MNNGRRSLAFHLLAGFFGLYVLFLYGPTITIAILSFQGLNGGLTFPMAGWSFHWFANLFQPQLVGDFGGSVERSLLLGGMVMVTTMVVSLAAGLAYRKGFRGDTHLFYLAVASLVVPSIVISLGVGLMFNELGLDTAWYGSAFGAQLTWTLPFGLLIMFAVFSRFNPSYEEAARDLGASPWQTLRHVVVPIIAPSLMGVALFGFTLSYDEFARTLLVSGPTNTLPLELYAMTTNITTPVMYALGTLTTGFSFVLIAGCVVAFLVMQRRRARRPG
jgi:putative spermidine/putrescine transport system permease protein